MSKFERAPGVPSVQITSFRRVRKRFKHGDAVGDEPRLYEDFFTNLAPTPNTGSASYAGARGDRSGRTKLDQESFAHPRTLGNQPSAAGDSTRGVAVSNVPPPA